MLSTHWFARLAVLCEIVFEWKLSVKRKLRLISLAHWTTKPIFSLAQEQHFLHSLPLLLTLCTLYARFEDLITVLHVCVSFMSIGKVFVHLSSGYFKVACHLTMKLSCEKPLSRQDIFTYLYSIVHIRSPREKNMSSGYLFFLHGGLCKLCIRTWTGRCLVSVGGEFYCQMLSNLEVTNNSMHYRGTIPTI